MKRLRKCKNKDESFEDEEAPKYKIKKQKLNLDFNEPSRDDSLDDDENALYGIKKVKKQLDDVDFNFIKKESKKSKFTDLVDSFDLLDKKVYQNEAINHQGETMNKMNENKVSSMQNTKSADQFGAEDNFRRSTDRETSNYYFQHPKTSVKGFIHQNIFKQKARN